MRATDRNAAFSLAYWLTGSLDLARRAVDLADRPQSAVALPWGRREAGAGASVPTAAWVAPIVGAAERVLRATPKPQRQSLAVQAAGGAESTANALLGLPDYLRFPVVLHDMQACSYREIADLMGMQPELVGRRIHQGRLALRAACAAESDTPDETTSSRTKTAKAPAVRPRPAAAASMGSGA